MAEIAISTAEERALQGEVARLEWKIRDLEHDNLSLRAELEQSRLAVNHLSRLVNAESTRADEANLALANSRAEIKRLKSHIWEQD